jgi:hypothetical protein
LLPRVPFFAHHTTNPRPPKTRLPRPVAPSIPKQTSRVPPAHAPGCCARRGPAGRSLHLCSPRRRRFCQPYPLTTHTPNPTTRPPPPAYTHIPKFLRT